MSRLRITGAIMVIVGGVLFLVALAVLPYFSRHFLSGAQPSFWDFFATHEAVILTGFAVGAIASAAWSLLADDPVMLVLGTGFSFYLLGRIFPVGARPYAAFGSGLWVATAAACTMSVGGILAVAGGRFARTS